MLLYLWSAVKQNKVSVSLMLGQGPKCTSMYAYIAIMFASYSVYNVWLCQVAIGAVCSVVCYISEYS